MTTKVTIINSSVKEGAHDIEVELKSVGPTNEIKYIMKPEQSLEFYVYDGRELKIRELL